MQQFLFGILKNILFIITVQSASSTDKGTVKIEGINVDYYAPKNTQGYTMHAMRIIIRYCTMKKTDPKCKPEWIIPNAAPDLEDPLKADNYTDFPEFKKYINNPVPQYKLKNLLNEIPRQFRDMIPPGFGRKLDQAAIDAIKKNCPGDTCKQDTDEHKHNRAVLGDYEVAMLRLAYPHKSLAEIDEIVETRLQRTYAVKKLLYGRACINEFAKPADNGVFDHMLLTLEQADTLINKLNSSLEYSHVIPENNKIRNKRAGDLLYFKITPKRQWPIGKAIPYGFDKTLSEKQREQIRTCIREISSKTCLTFTELSLNGSAPNISSIYFIRYITTSFCGISYIGVNEPYNPIYLSFLCNDMAGVACHEVMHALGADHEHVRPDRDDSITVNWTNIDPQSYDSFALADSAEYSSYGISYHCDSIMHYSSTTSARAYGLKTMTAKVNPAVNDPLMGQRKGLAQADVDAINKLYCPPQADCTDNSNFCGGWALQGLCYCGTTAQPDCYMLGNCRNSCNFCNCTSHGIN
uniref:Metalloendopeptidase n=2 Tax=Meloidogyne incognita TaxID=6306 RepID=A0A914KVV5_MELIC